MHLSGCVEQKLLDKLLPYTLQLQVTWRLHLDILSFAHLEAEEIAEEMGKGEVDPLVCELCVLPSTAPNISVPLLLHHHTKRKGYHQKNLGLLN